MNISWQWLGELVRLKHITPEQLSDKLTLAGFEIENINISKNKEVILDISNTANRSDTTNLVGMAREVASLFNQTLQLSDTQTNLTIIKTSNADDMFDYKHKLTSVVYNIQLEESPEWLQKKLSTYNIDSINNINDIIQLISIKWSQHLQIFDLDRIMSKVDCQEIETVETHLKISEQLSKIEAPITKDTKNIFVKMSIPCNSLRQKLYKNTTIDNNLRYIYKKEQSSRSYEIADAYSEAIMLITKLCKTQQYTKVIYISNVRNIKPTIKIDHQKIDQILGPIKRIDSLNTKNSLEKYKRYNIINNLQFIYHTNFTQCYIDIPDYRDHDIERSIDILEEISRIYGFDKFSDQLPKHKSLKNKQAYRAKYRINQIRTICRSLGLHETIHSSLGAQYHTSIYNPLTVEYNSLRDTLMPGLIKSTLYNLKHSRQNTEIFEIGRIFQRNNNSYEEVNHLAGILGGNKYVRDQWEQQPKSISWFQAKGDIEELFERLNLKVNWQSANTGTQTLLSKTSQENFKAKRTSIISINNRSIGIFGEINLNREVYNEDEAIYGFEILLDNLIVKDENVFDQNFKPYTKYPSIVRDIKVTVPNHMQVAYIFNTLKIINEPLIESIKLFDVYSNKNNSSHKSLGFRVTYSNSKGTLTNEQVDIIEKRIQSCMNNINF
uniref:phenylalanine--tRNA ligase n=1 Tax=Helminthocladia australis TaxID=260093 RepID=A0A1G4NTW8_9FLOR|nr:Phenylalanine-tRNA ligase beta subunit [Helminthocladia australis]SCW22054.1 Phenylalanine-tRNA ligase beta subunit [Helminthocladia australis]